MKKSALIAGLKNLLGDNSVLTDEQVILDCSKDYIGFRVYERFDGRFDAPRASCVVKPTNTKEVSDVLSFLNANKIYTTPRTGGSSVTQSIEPEEGGVIIDGSDMNEIIKLNETDMMVTVRCGTPFEYLESYLNTRGYTTGHQPQSLPMAQVGGLIATRSTGQFSSLYGGIEEMITGLEVVLPDGEIIRIKNNPRRSVGPDLRHLFIGSEGTLGFITEATLKIFPYRPEERWMHSYAIRNMKDGLELFREIMVAGYRPAVMRLHDEVEVETLFDSIAPDDYCLLLFIADGPKAIADATGAFIDQAIKKYDYVDLGKKPVESWLITRNDACDDMDRPKYYKMRAVADTCEISAPWSVVGDIHAAVRERAPEELDNLVTIGGHSSHSYLQGTNIYFTFGYFLGLKGGEYAKSDYMKLVELIMEETLKRGGSISHHHGSGKYRTRWMPQEHGSSYAVLKKIKKALDPNGIMNKGVLIADEE